MLKKDAHGNIAMRAFLCLYLLQTLSDVEKEVDNIAVLHDVFLALAS